MTNSRKSAWAAGAPLEPFPIGWTHPVDKDMLQHQNLEWFIPMLARGHRIVNHSEALAASLMIYGMKTAIS